MSCHAAVFNSARFSASVQPHPPPPNRSVDASSYIPVNLTSLGGRLAWAQHHPEKAAAIAAAAQRFAREHITAGHVVLYWGQLLEEYASLQRFTVTLPPDACTCWPIRAGSTVAGSRPSYMLPGSKRCKWVCDYRS